MQPPGEPSEGSLLLLTPLPWVLCQLSLSPSLLQRLEGLMSWLAFLGVEELRPVSSKPRSTVFASDTQLPSLGWPVQDAFCPPGSTPPAHSP